MKDEEVSLKKRFECRVTGTYTFSDGTIVQDESLVEVNDVVHPDIHISMVAAKNALRKYDKKQLVDSDISYEIVRSTH